ncbi:MAG: hypothetical protein H0U10_10525 [Chloroflexia bacterium]|nr:hypothetical protein [Chloroflexia bacterium]
MSPPLRLLVFGMACAASAPTLAALLEAGFAVEALVLPGGASAHPDRRSALTPQPPLPCEGEGEQSASAKDSPPSRVGDPRGEGVGGGGRSPQPAASPQILGRCGEPERLAAAAGVPVFRAAPDAPRVLALASGVDAIVVACFPVRLPPDLLARPRLGGLNVHPSLLPLGRGPEPVFWTLRRGERRTGATVHRLDAGWDTGSVVIQRAVAVLAGVRAPDLERDLMALGGTLLVEALPLLAAGRLVPIPQDDAQATRAPVPAPADWLVPTDLPAGWAFNFVRGVSPLGEPLAVRGPFGIVPVRDAVAHHPTERPDVLLEERPGGILRVRFSPGWVEFEPG